MGLGLATGFWGGFGVGFDVREIQAGLGFQVGFGVLGWVWNFGLDLGFGIGLSLVLGWSWVG